MLEAAAHWLSNALGVAWSALAAAFLAVRVVLYLVLVALAWYAVVEEHAYARTKHKTGSHRVPQGKTELAEGIVTTQPRSPCGGGGLTEGSLRSHDSAQPGQGRPLARQYSAGSASTVTFETDSIADWSIWAGEPSSETSDSPQPDTLEPQTSTASPSPAAGALPAVASLPPVAPRAPPPHTRPRVHHPTPVTVQRVHAPVSARAAVGGLANEGLDEAGAVGDSAGLAQVCVGAAAWGASDKAVLSQATAELEGGSEIWEPSKDRVLRDRHGRRRREHKPFLARKLEKWIYKPIHDKSVKTGLLTYAAVGKMGQRMERGLHVTGEQLSMAVNNAGLAALDSVDHLIKKWVLFGGILMGLTIALLPLPSGIRLEVRAPCACRLVTADPTARQAFAPQANQAAVGAGATGAMGGVKALG